MTTALQIAQQRKAANEQAAREKAVKAELAKKYEEETFKQLWATVGSVLMEFDGVSGIVYKPAEGRNPAELWKNGTPVARVIVEYHSYDNPNVEYHEKITEIAIGWYVSEDVRDPLSDRRRGSHSSSRSRFVDGFGEAMAEFV